MIHDRDEAHREIERVARQSYGRLVAYLSSRTRDVAAAEDALGGALVAALTAWPRDGVPPNPEGWLLTSARRALVDAFRHRRVVSASEPTLLLLQKPFSEPTVTREIPDERLKLLFVCAHPAIDESMHTALMLQTVLGLDAARIAGAFLVSPKTMGQRLVRAKTKIRDGGIRFAIPESRELEGRLTGVLEAIYAAFGIGWDDGAGVDRRGRDLADEAIWLARVLVETMPEQAEARGLLALMLHCEARRAARRGPDGEYIPLSDQDPNRWSRPLMQEAEAHLTEAFRRGSPGRFQLEAAIQSAHAERAWTGRVEWNAIVRFYEELLRISPTLGARTSHAAALGEARGSEAGLAALDEIEVEDVADYQPYFAVRARLLRGRGDASAARAAYDRAIGLAEDPAVRRFLLEQRG